MTKRLEDFDFEAACRTLESVAGSSPPEAQDAIELAAYALHFLHVTEQFNAFREYLRDVKEPATREVGTHVKVGEKTYEVWSDSTGRLRLVPAPSLQELKKES